MWFVIAVAFLGTFLGDQHIGRLKGDDFLNRRPAWKAKSGRVLALKRHRLWLILGIRFLYGLRTFTPFLIGVSGVAPFLFFVLNGIGALVWAIVVGVLGYFLRHAVELMLGEVSRTSFGLSRSSPWWADVLDCAKVQQQRARTGPRRTILTSSRRR